MSSAHLGPDFMYFFMDCSCKNGKMLLRCAGPYSDNPGRYYYKCPVGNHRDERFRWCDEYHENDPPHLRPEYVTMQQLHPVQARSEMEESTTSQPQFIGNARSLHSPRLRSDLEKEIAFIFMALVLIMLGIVIGKLI